MAAPGVQTMPVPPWTRRGDAPVDRAANNREPTQAGWSGHTAALYWRRSVDLAATEGRGCVGWADPRSASGPGRVRRRGRRCRLRARPPCRRGVAKARPERHTGRASGGRSAPGACDTEGVTAIAAAPDPKRQRLKHAFAVLLPATLFGFLVTAQWQGQQERSQIAVRYNAPLTDAAFALQKEQNDLKAQLQDLRAQLDSIQANASTQSGAASELQKRITELRGQAGLAPMTGDGVVVQLDDSHTVAPGATCRALGSGSRARARSASPRMTVRSRCASRSRSEIERRGHRGDRRRAVPRGPRRHAVPLAGRVLAQPAAGDARFADDAHRESLGPQQLAPL